MATRKSLVAKKWGFSAQNDDEKESRRQKIEFSTPKRRREQVSSPKKGVSRLKMTTRLGLVAKKWGFSAQNGDEIKSRRQKHDFLTPKRRREKGSSPKNGVSRLKMTTRLGLVAKKSSFSAQNGDEKRARRQKHDFLTSKRRRERVSSPKNQVFWPKIATRKGLVAKKGSFPAQNDVEIRARRQKIKFSAQK
ncbi:hypothetical protein NSQ14_03195 [Caldifermentibacillus hisashii]|uniref:hypothetical protein n=1 Tax=Caldifermentibacillus hisashii TaxID=996558 RepID=UPI0031FE249E